MTIRLVIGMLIGGIVGMSVTVLIIEADIIPDQTEIIIRTAELWNMEEFTEDNYYLVICHDQTERILVTLAAADFNSSFVVVCDDDNGYSESWADGREVGYEAGRKYGRQEIWQEVEQATFSIGVSREQVLDAIRQTRQDARENH